MSGRFDDVQRRDASSLDDENGETVRRVWPRLLRYLVFGALGAGLAWAVATHTLVAALVEMGSPLARTLAPDNPAVLLANGNRDGAPAVLAREPGNTRALAIFGRSAHEAGDLEKAGIFMRAAARRSVREAGPHGWLVSDAIRRQDWSQAVQHADILMRMNQEAIEPLAPLLTELAERPASATAVHDALSLAPPWRPPFMFFMLRSITDARTPLQAMVAMQEAGAPPTVSDLRVYLDFLIERRSFDLAYYTWLQFLPADRLASAGPLFNGSFEARPTGLPFDWALPESGSATVMIARRPDRPSERALLVELGHGRADIGGVRQLLRLPPGNHRVSGEVTGDLTGLRGPRWRMTCVDGPSRRIGESEMFTGRIGDWRKFTFDFSVPETGCRAQAIHLDLDARTPSERLVSGTIWFDDMAIGRLP